MENPKGSGIDQAHGDAPKIERTGPASSGAGMPKNPDELKRLDEGAPVGGAPSAETRTIIVGEPRPLSDLSKRICAYGGQLASKAVEMFTGHKMDVEREGAELVAESAVAVARHGSTTLDPATEARWNLGGSLAMVAGFSLLKRWEQAVERRRASDPNAPKT